MNLSPYLLGCLVNFVHDDDDGVCIVHNQNCTLEQLQRVHQQFKESCWNVSTPSRMSYGSVNYFKCTLVSELVQIPILPYTTSSENWAYVSGFIDMNAELKLIDNDLRLTLFCATEELMHRLWQFIGVPAMFSEGNPYQLTYTATNVLDVIGQLAPDSPKQHHLRTYLHGHEKIGKCLVYKMDPKSVMPTKARYSDVGYDVSIIRLAKRLNASTTLWDTGLSLRIPFGFYVELVPRSSLSKSGFMLSNSTGIIDRSYQGNLLVALTQTAEDAYELEEMLPFRCVQLIFRRQEFIDLEETSAAQDVAFTSARANGGFGSSGV
jgi:deoxyuridine 5'-triphosphate nucleotidohydrolase